MNLNKITEFIVANGLITRVVDAAEDGFNVFASWVESVALKEVNQVGHAGFLAAMGQGIEKTHLLVIWLGGKMVSCTVAIALQAELFLKKSHKEVDTVRGNRVVCPVSVCEAALFSN